MNPRTPAEAESSGAARRGNAAAPQHERFSDCYLSFDMLFVAPDSPQLSAISSETLSGSSRNFIDSSATAQDTSDGTNESPKSLQNIQPDPNLTNVVESGPGTIAEGYGEDCGPVWKKYIWGIPETILLCFPWLCACSCCNRSGDYQQLESSDDPDSPRTQISNGTESPSDSCIICQGREPSPSQPIDIPQNNRSARVQRTSANVRFYRFPPPFIWPDQIGEYFVRRSRVRVRRPRIVHRSPNSIRSVHGEIMGVDDEAQDREEFDSAEDSAEDSSLNPRADLPPESLD